ncbi:hypothetical protein KJ758_02255 [Patescibacteria group bacterium]|nr:hypothetical protein [Patescibacteria group bacterium]
MSGVLRVIIGIVVLLVGASMVYKTPWYLGILGRVYWAERNFGSGGTRTFYKLMGVGVSIIGMIVIADLWEQIIGGFIINIFTP